MVANQQPKFNYDRLKNGEVWVLWKSDNNNNPNKNKNNEAVGNRFSAPTSTARRSCRDPGTAVIHFWLPGGIRRRPQRVMSAGSGGRRVTLRPLLLQLRPGAVSTVAAAAAAARAAAAAAGAAV